MSKKVLVAYYSWSGTTKHLAEKLDTILGPADLFEIKVAQDTFPTDMYQTSDVAKEQIESGNLPELVDHVENIADYDFVLVGGPVWSGEPATPVKSFLQDIQDYQGIVAPFYTDAGSFSSYEKDFKNDAGSLHVATGFEGNSDAKSWLHDLLN